MFSDFHGRHTQQSGQYVGEGYSGLLKNSDAENPVIFVTCNTSSLQAKLYCVNVKYWA